MGCYVDFSRILTVVASVTITVGLYAQALKIWSGRSAKDVSWIIVIALLFNELSWLNYGVAIAEWPIKLVALCNIPAILILTLGYIRYRKGDKRNAT